MTVAEAAQLLGRTGTIRQAGLTVGVTVIDVKQSYGRTRYLVSPLAGKGEIWVEQVTINANALGVAL